MNPSSPARPVLTYAEATEIVELLRSPLLSWSAKLRLFAEPFVRHSARADTVARFVVRRFGRELAERVFEPMMRGVYGASIAELGLQEPAGCGSTT